MLNTMTHKKIQVTGGEGVISKLPKFGGQCMIKASHITIYIKLCHSYKIWAPVDILIFVCTCCW